MSHYLRSFSFKEALFTSARVTGKNKKRSYKIAVMLLTVPGTSTL